MLRRFVVILAAAIVAACSARASTNNLLVNGNFNGGSSGWTTYTYGGGWANFEIPGNLIGTTISPPHWPSVWPAGAGTNFAALPITPLYDGTLQLTVGGGNGPSGGYAYQTNAAAPNVQYTLTIQAGAQNWWLPTGEIRLWFLDANRVVISSNFVETCLSVNNPNASPAIALYDVGVPYQNWTNTAVSPAGTKFIKVELCNPLGTGSAWFDNAYLTAPIDPPVIANLYPDGTVLQQNTNKLSFNATSAAPINSSGISLVLNGVDVSGSLVFTGSGTTNVNVSYTGLQANMIYTAAITVVDTVNLTSIKNVTFDTYAPIYVWEAEDYDFTNGQFIQFPTPSDTPMPNSYFGVTGTQGIDFNDYSADGPRAYRPDPMSTASCGDVPLQNHVALGVSDYNIGYFDGGGFPSSGNVGLASYEPTEWVNYTRNFTNNTYNLYARIAGGNGGNATVPVSKVVSGWKTSTQTTTNLGVFNFPANNWGSYSYVPMTDRFGNAVAITLSGTNTLRVSAGSGANVNFFMILPADTNTPTITSVYPDGSTLVQGTNKLTFTVSSAGHSIAQSNVVVTLNGVTNNNLVFTGSASSWNVSVPLTLNVTNYTAVITVTNDIGYGHATTLYFDTFNPASYDIEAEDFDFDPSLSVVPNGSGLRYIDNPVITSNAAANSYFDQSGGYSVDEYPGDANGGYVLGTSDFHFRQYDFSATSLCTDTPTRDLLAAQLTNSLAFNYNIGWWSSNGWYNYTHHYPVGNFNVYARLAGNSGTTNIMDLWTVSVSATNHLGTFTEVGRGYNAFDWIPLLDTNGHLVTVTLGGLATLRTTTLGNVNPNSYLLVPMPASLQWSYSAGALTLSWTNAAYHLQVQTNALTGNWSNYPGGGTSPVTITPNKSLVDVFFRLSN
jgi:hypothetical protein